MADIKLDTRELDRILGQLKPKAEQVIGTYASAVEGDAKKMAPYDTGALQNSINAKKQTSLLWWVQDGVEYGIYQELGFHSRGGKFIQNPFMVPAVERWRRKFLDAWTELFK